MLEHIKSELKNIRESAGFSQDELADAIGVNRKTIISIESDNGADSKLSTIRRIMAYLKISFEDLYPENTDKSRNTEI